jgi:L-ascorbate metabolism protein UlaG (beta-lactamase superfamily)
MLVIILITCAYAYLQLPKFGSLPEGSRLDAIARSPNHADGEFRNLVPTPMFTDDSSFVSVLLSNLFTLVARRAPEAPIPSVKTDLNSLDGDAVVWLGHSSYFVQLGGRRILIDPVFSRAAAPVPFANRAFDGTSIYSAEDMPAIDYLLITHDHWDHLDYPSVTALRSKVRHVITGLGVGAHFERWGYAQETIHEADWFDALSPDGDATVHVVPARHYSGRLLTRNKTLWVGFVIETPGRRVLFSGDTGDGPHIQAIAERFAGFDLVALDFGQYDARWAHLHLTPEQAAQAAEDLRARALLPAHVGRFALARHAWDEPFIRIASASQGRPYRLLTPTIGEPVNLNGEQSPFSRWWETVE